MMLGSSDSNEEFGLPGRRLGLYRAQRSLAAVAHARGVDPTLFHGRGGAIGRGGGPAGRAILGQAPGSTGGHLKFTEQVQLLARLRAAPSGSPDAEELRRLVQLTINGVAAGVQNTG